MVGWHHQVDGHKFEQVPGVVDGQENMSCCSPWGGGVGHDLATELNLSLLLPLDLDWSLHYFLLDL